MFAENLSYYYIFFLIIVSMGNFLYDKVCLFKLQLAYLPYKRRDIVLDNESNELLSPVEGLGMTLEDSKEEKKNRKGILNWFKLRV